MQLVALTMVLAMVVGLAAGGRLGLLADLSMEGMRWLLVAVGLQLVGSMVGAVYAATLVGSTVCVGVFLRRNLQHPGIALLAFGFSLNVVVVLLNGAMPVSLTALARAGTQVPATAFDGDPRHEVIDGTTALGWLGDVIPVAIPGFGQAVSPGDVAVAAGAGLLLFTAMGGGRYRSEREAPLYHTT